MKALILVGGFGTRLRPLTLTCPKPLVEFANKSILWHQVEALREAGVTEVILAVSYSPDELVRAVDEYQRQNPGLKITISREDEPMGTAGPIALASESLSSCDAFFVLNSDVICAYPFKEMAEFHRKHGGEGTIVTTPVEDPSKYGVVVSDAATGRIERFVEKPKEFVGDQINAGLYILSPDVLKRIPRRPTSIERDVFPKIAADKKLYCLPLASFWMDVGQPHDYLTGQRLYLAHLQQHSPASLHTSDGGKKRKAGAYEVRGNAIVHPTASVGAGTVLGPDVVIGAKCTIGEHCRISSSTVLSETNIGNACVVSGSIVGRQCTLGDHSRLQELCVLGDDVQVSAERFIRGTKVLPHKGVKEDVFNAGHIII